MVGTTTISNELFLFYVRLFTRIIGIFVITIRVIQHTVSLKSIKTVCKFYYELIYVLLKQMCETSLTHGK